MTTLKARYSALQPSREPFLRRARSAAEHTLPKLIPPEGSTSSTTFKSQYQSVGAHGVTTLAAKLLIALLPPGHPFFKLDVDKHTLAEIAGDDEARAEFDKAMSDVEQTILAYIESSPLRTSTFEVLKHLLVAGNVLLYKPPSSPTGDVRVYDLSKYVVKRDAAGNLLECVLKETISPTVLPEEIRAACGCDVQSHKETKDVDLYTGMRRDGDRWLVTQEINDIAVPNARDEYPLDKNPWIVLRLQKIDGENFGRGYVEDYLGDLISLEGLMKAIVKGSAAAAKVLFFVAPNSVTKATDCNKAASGAFVTGNAQDITTLGLDKFADFRVALETIDRIERRLGAAFMLNGSVQREAERVTAEEVRFMARELDDALGGIYSILAQEFQLPLIKRVMTDMVSLGRLPELPESLMNPVIVTGLDALGRTSDLAKLDNLVRDIFALSPEIASKYVNLSNYIKRRGAYLRIDTDGLIRSQEEVEQADQQAQMQQMMQQMAPQMMQGSPQS